MRSAEGAWTEAWQHTIEAEEAAEIEAAVEEAEALAPLRPAEIFGAMFAEMTPQLREQQRELAAAGEEGVEG